MNGRVSEGQRPDGFTTAGQHRVRSQPQKALLNLKARTQEQR
ncbi:MAG: hypothetical protein AAFZ80_12410 [Cyanobacteria bacterium P01_A01_bin.105]